MCNGWNHKRGCICGFGPPYPWTMAMGPLAPYYEAVLTDKSLFKRSLKEIGLDAEAVRDEVRQYHALGLPVKPTALKRMKRSRRNSLVSRIKSLLGREVYKPIRVETFWVRIPVFRLHSPAVEGSKITCISGQTAGRKADWAITVFGFGIADSRTLYMTCETAFSSKSGACKLVVLPVHIRVTLAKVYRGKKYIRRAISIEAAHRSASTIVHLGIKTRPEGECLDDLAFRRGRSEVFELFDDEAADVVRYKRTMESGKIKRFTVGVDRFNLSGSFRVEIRQQKRVSLEFILPCGYDYRVCPLDRPLGIVWRVERGPNPRSAWLQTGT